MAQRERIALDSALAESTVDDERLRRFLHHGHVFSAAVKEVLESKFLSEVSDDSMTVPQFHLLKIITLNGHHQVGEVHHRMADRAVGIGRISSRRRQRTMTIASQDRPSERSPKALLGERPGNQDGTHADD